jgi:hypothetical protein
MITFKDEFQDQFQEKTLIVRSTSFRKIVEKTIKKVKQRQKQKSIIYDFVKLEGFLFLLLFNPPIAD